jgi:hypothetical protein
MGVCFSTLGVSGGGGRMLLVICDGLALRFLTAQQQALGFHGRRIRRNPSPRSTIRFLIFEVISQDFLGFPHVLYCYSFLALDGFCSIQAHSFQRFLPDDSFRNSR